MQIDRARFLFLTASLAGGGCSSNPPVDPATPPAPAETGQELVVAETPGADTTSASDTSDAAPVETASSADPEPTASSQPAQAPSGACDNDTGTVPACSIAKPPGPHCESFSDTKASCKAFRGGLRGAIAAKAVACLNAVSGTPDVCDWERSQKCGNAAVHTACIQPSTFNQCSPILSQCAGYAWSKLTMDDCQRLLSAVKDGQRQAMITCMSEGCSADSCMWSLR